MIISIQSNNRRYFAKQSKRNVHVIIHRKTADSSAISIARGRSYVGVSWRSLGGASFSFRSNFHEHKRELKPADRGGRSYFLRQAPRSRDEIVIPGENFLKLLSSFGKLQLACTPRVFESTHKHQKINPPRVLSRVSFSETYVSPCFRWRKATREIATWNDVSVCQFSTISYTAKYLSSHSTS